MLRLRGGARKDDDDDVAMAEVRDSALREAGRGERIFALLQANLTDAEILAHPTLRGHCVTPELLATARAECATLADADMQANRRLDALTRETSQRVRGNLTEDEILRWRKKSLRAQEERFARARLDVEEGAGAGAAGEQGELLTEETLPAYMAANEASISAKARARSARPAAPPAAPPCVRPSRPSRACPPPPSLPY
jgi:hypothetical protein